MIDIPEEFWPLFERKLHDLHRIYAPVHIGRLYPFLVSWLPAKMVEVALMRAVERGLCSFRIVEHPRPDGSPEKIRVIDPPPLPRVRIKAGSAP